MIEPYEEYRRQHAALVSLTRSGLWNAADENAGLREIAVAVAKGLDVERVSVWRFSAAREAIVCLGLYEASMDRLSSGQELKEKDFPSYFRALAEEEIIAAHDARKDPRTREFTDLYLKPNGITSMLDAPVYVADGLAGVLCVEQVGEAREWSHTEESFAVSVANLVSLMLAQRALARSEARLRTILESEPECVKIVSLDGRLLEVNRAGLAMIDAENLDQLRDRSGLDLVHPADRETVRQAHQRACRGETTRAQYRVIGLKGRERWFDSHSAPLLEADGSIGSILSVTRDVTEQRRAAETILKVAGAVSMPIGEAFLENLTREIAEALSVKGGAILLVDPDQPGDVFSQALFIDGKKIDDVRYEIDGTPCETVVKGESLVVERSVRERYPEDPMLVDFGIESYAGVPIRGESGRVIGMVAVFSETPMEHGELVLSTLQIFAARVSGELSRRTVETRLETVWRRQEMILESTADGILGIDAEGRVVFENPAALAMLDWAPGELIGRRGHDVFHHHLGDGREYPFEQCPVTRTLKDGETRRVENELFFRKDGSSFSVEYICAPVKRNDGRIDGAVISFRDMTERRHLIHSLGERVKELRAMHNVADLLRGPETPCGELLRRVAENLLGGLQYSEYGCASVAFGECRADTPGWENAWGVIEQSFAAGNGVVGRVGIGYREQIPEGETGPFLLEERLLIDWVAEALASHFDQLSSREALRENQAFLQMASRAGKLGAWSIEVPGGEQRWSDATREIYGLEEGPPPRKKELLELFVPEDGERYREACEACAQGGTPFDLEACLRERRGESVCVRVIGEAVRNESGEIIRVQGAVQDITERKKAEASLAASETRFRQLAESMPMIVWTASADGNVDYANDRCFEYTGIINTNAPLIWEEALHPDDLERCLERWQTAVERGTPFAIEYRIRRGEDDSYRWFDVRAVPVRDSAGNVVKWYGTAVDIDDIKRLQEESTRLADRLTATLESMTDAVHTVDREWRFTYLNREAERLLERPRDQLLGRKMWDEFPEEEAKGFRKAYERAVREKTSVTVEGFFAPLGKWFEVKASPSPEGLTVFFRDVTERRRHREAIRESEERFALLTKATNDAIWDWNLATKTLWWNEGIEHLFRYDRKDVPPTIEFWMEQIHPDDRSVVVAGIEEALEGEEKTWTAEYRFRRNDGSYAYVLDRGHISRNEAGKAVRMIGGMTDLSDRRNAEERVREQAALLDLAQDAILVRDLEHRILYWNKSAERLYGWTAEEVIGQPVQEMIYRNPAEFLKASETTLREGEWVGEISQRSKYGETLTVEGRWTLVRDEHGMPKSILAINTDLTERKKLETQFLRAQRLESIGTLAGGIAHDLNNILAPIVMGIDLLRDEETDPQRQALFETIAANAQRGAALVSQVLTFARGVEGKRHKVDVLEIAREIQRVVRDTFPKNIAIQVEAPVAPWPVEADATQLHQVLMNLCVNARDAMPEGGTLTVSLQNTVLDEVYSGMTPESKPGPYLIIRVEDTGKGIPRANQNSIFDPFFTTKEVGKGTGLGLSTVLTIVKSHGGFINVYSEPGKGARFKIYLPALASGEAVETVAIERSGLPRGRGELILVVDDEAAIRDVARKTLERFGYQVILAANGAEAVAAYVREKGIAVVLTDMAMPIMDGPATIAALKAINPDVKIIGSSGMAANGNVAKAAGFGVRNFIPKPYTAEALLTELDRILHGAGI